MLNEFIKLRVVRMAPADVSWSAGLPVFKTESTKNLFFPNSDRFKAYIDGLKKDAIASGYDFDYRGFDSDWLAELVILKKRKS